MQVAHSLHFVSKSKKLIACRLIYPCDNFEFKDLLPSNRRCQFDLFAAIKRRKQSVLIANSEMHSRYRTLADPRPVAPNARYMSEKQKQRQKTNRQSALQRWKDAGQHHGSVGWMIAAYTFSTSTVYGRRCVRLRHCNGRPSKNALIIWKVCERSRNKTVYFVEFRTEQKTVVSRHTAPSVSRAANANPTNEWMTQNE